MQEIWSLLVKGTHDCNLDCMYCYDKPMREKFLGKRMNYKTLDKILNLCSQYAKEIHWIWHGGEPTLMGIDWYVKAQELFNKYYNKTKFTQSMQSNGVLLDENWAKFSIKYKVDIGVSFDVFNQTVRIGSKQVNIENNIKKFLNAGGHLGTITVINKTNYKKQIELYNYFKENFNFSPAFNHIYRTDGSLKNNLEISAEDYFNEFEKYYNYWINDVNDGISERSVNLITRNVFGSRKLVCTYDDCRHNWISVNPVGVLYPCDRFVPEKYSMGNINDYDSIEDIYKNNGHKLYCMEIEQRFLTKCKDCGYLNYCGGGCNANHIAVSGSGCGTDDFSCELFRRTFNGVYNIWRNIDIYNHTFNREVVKILLDGPYFTLKEIKEFLYKKGIKKNFKYDANNILNCNEFKLFRIFNPYQGKINSHIDCINYKLENINEIITNKFSMVKVKKQREDTLEKLYEKNKIDIAKLWEE